MHSVKERSTALAWGTERHAARKACTARLASVWVTGAGPVVSTGSPSAGHVSPPVSRSQWEGTVDWATVGSESASPETEKSATKSAIRGASDVAMEGG